MNRVDILGHNWFSTYELLDVISLVTLWSGTGVLELGAMNVPAIACSHFAQKDYPVDLTTPTNRENYEKQLSNPHLVEVSDQLNRQCISLIKYQSTDEVSIPYEYITRNRSNKNYWPPTWKKDQILSYMREGDKFVREIANRVIQY